MGLKFRPTSGSSTNALSNLRIIPVSRYLVIRSRRDFLQTYPFLAKKRIENLKTELGNVHIRRLSLFQFVVPIQTIHRWITYLILLEKYFYTSIKNFTTLNILWWKLAIQLKGIVYNYKNSLPFSILVKSSKSLYEQLQTNPR